MDASSHSAEADFRFAVRYRTGAIAEGTVWLDYSLHPASKLGLHNALLAEHDRNEILAARGETYECAVFVLRHGEAERLTDEGAERLFASLPHGDVKWTDLCRCLLPPLPEAGRAVPPAVGPVAEQLPLFAHTHTAYDDVESGPVRHALDVSA